MSHDKQPEARVRPFRAGPRVAIAIAGICLAGYGSIHGTDDLWPFGPLSQYAMVVPANSTVPYIRISATTDRGSTMRDLPVNPEADGVTRAEIEARTSQIQANPALLQNVANGWRARHPHGPYLVTVQLIRDTTTLRHGRVSGPVVPQLLATWRVQ